MQRPGSATFRVLAGPSHGGPFPRAQAREMSGYFRHWEITPICAHFLVGDAGIELPASSFASAGHFPIEYARLSVAERMAGIRKFGLHLAKKGLAFHSKESVNVVIGGRRSCRRTLRPGDRADRGSPQ
jgi:hypothetical protein